ncbi:hypothetical protein [Paraburkholderia caballeronis]|uniref:hypothetical protein n=1 Tax=Paraburkholderia caballeronis TaxID=416943 RepID=UPI00106580BE|nr:hypothetical protein [Paraburkholderia caballeronis]
MHELVPLIPRFQRRARIAQIPALLAMGRETRCTLCRATEFRAIGIGEFVRQPVERRETGPSRSVKDVPMDGSPLKALHRCRAGRMVRPAHGGLLLQ